MRRKDTFLLALGVLVGLALAGPASATVRQLTATPSTQSFYVNGQRTQFEAYAIGGANYVKLRDIGKAVNFGVTYDAAANSVYIDTNAHYEQEVAQPAQTTPAPSSGLTEESVRAALDALKVRYPHGSVYPAPYRSTSNGPYGAASNNCAGWAILCSDAAFGNLPWRKTAFRWADVRVGDLVQYNNDSGNHVIVVLSKTDDWLYFTDSGRTQKVYWTGGYTREWLEQRPGLVLYTRYPN